MKKRNVECSKLDPKIAVSSGVVRPGIEPQRELAGPVQVLPAQLFQLAGGALLRRILGCFLEPGNYLTRTVTLDNTMPQSRSAAYVLDDISEIGRPLNPHCHLPDESLSSAIMPQIRLWKTCGVNDSPCV
jgi:hypothetical protein